MKECIAFLVAAILIAASLPYVYQIRSKQVFPTLPTWIIGAAATSLNVASYLVATNIDLVSGVLGLTDVLACWFILIAVAMSVGFKIQLKAFEKYYLVGAGLIVIFWMVSSNAFVTNLLMQLLITTGCSSTIQSLLYANDNQESFVFWGLVLLAATLSLYPAAVDGNLLAVIYSVRGIVIVCVILALMFRLHRKKKAVPHSEFLR